jgi:hypothetical protein
VHIEVHILEILGVKLILKVAVSEVSAVILYVQVCCCAFRRDMWQREKHTERDLRRLWALDMALQYCFIYPKLCDFSIMVVFERWRLHLSRPSLVSTSLASQIRLRGKASSNEVEDSRLGPAPK